jgi:hypothetical protein
MEANNQIKVDTRPFDCVVGAIPVSGHVTLSGTEVPQYSVVARLSKDIVYNFTIAQVGAGVSKTFETRYLTRMGSRRLYATSAFHYTDKKVDLLFEKALTILVAVTYPTSILPDLGDAISHTVH